MFAIYGTLRKDKDEFTTITLEALFSKVKEDPLVQLMWKTAEMKQNARPMHSCVPRIQARISVGDEHKAIYTIEGCLRYERRDKGRE